jgi:hypothetical protein
VRFAEELLARVTRIAYSDGARRYPAGRQKSAHQGQGHVASTDEADALLAHAAILE